MLTPSAIPSAIACPYCGEVIEILIDTSIPSQSYIEDCQVCCRPITVGVEVAADGEFTVRVAGENEA
jgi:hypothetical protein